MSSTVEAEQDFAIQVPIAVAIEEVGSSDEIDRDDHAEDLENVPVIHLQAIQPEPSAPSRPSRSYEGMETLVLEAIDLEEGGSYAGALANPPSSNRIPHAATIETPYTRNVQQDSTFFSSHDMPIRDGTTSSSRAQFISVLLAPTCSDELIGIRFFPKQPGKIGRIEEGSILSHSPLRAGDRLVTLNGKACHQKTSRELAALILQSRGGYLNMVFETPSEDADVGLVHCMLMKETPEDSLSIKVGNFRGGEVRITEIIPNGVASKSLLNVGDTVMEVNGSCCANYSSSHEVVTLLRTAPKYVNILVRVGANTAVMVSEVNPSMIPISNVNRTGVMNTNAAGRVPRASSRKKNAQLEVAVAGAMFIVLGFIIVISVVAKLRNASNSSNVSNRSDLSNPYEDTLAPDRCEKQSKSGGRLNQLSSDVQFNSRYSPRFIYATVRPISLSMVGHFDLPPFDGTLTALEANEDVDQVLEKTSEFFAHVLERSFGDHFLFLQLVFESWSYESCPGSAAFDISVRLNAEFKDNPNDYRFNDGVITLGAHVERTLKLFMSNGFYGSYILDYVKTVGSENVFSSTIRASWQ